MIDTILFDLDGTLIDSNHLILTTFKHVFETALKDVKMCDEDYLPFIGPTLYQSFSNFTSDPAEIELLIQTYRKKNLELHDQYVKPFDGAQALLKALKDKGYRLGVVSSKMHFLVERGLNVCGLDGYMDYIVGSDDVVNHKPHPEPILKALSFFNTTDAIYVGDHPNDIKAGQAAGIKTVAVNYSLLKDALHQVGATYYVDNLLQIEEVISCTT
ncbi:MAG: HAD-IA family hydrolase [Acholeplasma sp.]|jgi:HAD superfamily hydrolase (TIGR01549 family)|nr:HAD-IA family hydrolase [Acholeplasma sp.]